LISFSAQDDEQFIAWLTLQLLLSHTSSPGLIPGEHSVQNFNEIKTYISASALAIRLHPAFILPRGGLPPREGF
jgi:hypothetical protein